MVFCSSPGPRASSRGALLGPRLSRRRCARWGSAPRRTIRRGLSHTGAGNAFTANAGDRHDCSDKPRTGGSNPRSPEEGVLIELGVTPTLIQPVILCGGSGTRLWPLSREHHPKPLHALNGERTLLEETGARCAALESSVEPLVICNEAH